MGDYFGTGSGRWCQRGDSSPMTAKALGVSRVVLATSWFARTRGMLGLSQSDALYVLVPCHDIHTVGMRINIDVAFFSATGKVIEVHRDVSPGKRIRNKRAAFVGERQASERCWFQPGQRVCWMFG